MRSVFHIARIAVLELLFERVLYLLVGFAGLALVLGLLLSKLTYGEQAKMMLDFLLAAIHVSMVLFSVFMGVSLFQREMTQGSISMVLSKPIARSSFLFGKFIGQLGVQFVMALAMAALTLAMVFTVDEPGTNLSSKAILQAVAMIGMEVVILTSITYLFAVNAGAFTTAMAGLCFFCLGHSRGLISSNLNDRASSSTWEFIKVFVPDLELFNIKNLASYGQAVSWTEIGWGGLYAAVCTGFFLFVAAVCFERKDIPT